MVGEGLTTGGTPLTTGGGINPQGFSGAMRLMDAAQRLATLVATLDGVLPQNMLAPFAQRALEYANKAIEFMEMPVGR